MPVDLSMICGVQVRCGFALTETVVTVTVVIFIFCSPVD